MKMICNGTCIGCLYPAVNGRLYAISVWGYCFIYRMGTPRPDNEIKQVHSSHLFYVQSQPFHWRMRNTLQQNEKICILRFSYHCFFEVSAQRGRIDDNYGARENEWMIPLIILIILACLFIYAWIAGQINKK